MNLDIQQTASYAGDERWNWSVWIDGPDVELDQVESVEWVLHPTFPHPIMLVKQRQSKFRLDGSGWGEFEINARVTAKDGGQQQLKHWLRLAESAGGSAQPTSEEKSAAFIDSQRAVSDQAASYADQAASYAEDMERQVPAVQAPTRRRIDSGRKPKVKSGGIFVSYRWQESSHFTGRLCDRLLESFGTDRVFLDVDKIEPGVDFAQAINRAVASCKVLLAIIGPRWLTITDERGRRRLENVDNFVRLEIKEALARNVRVIPILVDDAVMPGRQDLPESLDGLVLRRAFTVRHESFRNDADRLVTVLRSIIPDR